jgi:hypothetical protein
MISIFEKNPATKPTLQKGTICDSHRKTYPLEGYNLRWPSQNLPFIRIPFVTAIAKPTLWKGTICNSHHKTYPLEGYLPFWRVQPRLTKTYLIASLLMSGFSSASHQITGITHIANWHATNPTLSMARLSLATPSKLVPICSVQSLTMQLPTFLSNQSIGFKWQNKVARNIMHTTHKLGWNVMNFERTASVSLHIFFSCEGREMNTPETSKRASINVFVVSAHLW